MFGHHGFTLGMHQTWEAPESYAWHSRRTLGSMGSWWQKTMSYGVTCLEPDVVNVVISVGVVRVRHVHLPDDVNRFQCILYGKGSTGTRAGRGWGDSKACGPP